MKTKRYSEDIPEVGLDIFLKSAEIEDHVTKLGASTRGERTVTISLLDNSTYFVCHLTVIDKKQMGHFIIRGTFGVRQVTYAIKMKYFTIKTNSFFLSRMNSI